MNPDLTGGEWILFSVLLQENFKGTTARPWRTGGVPWSSSSTLEKEGFVKKCDQLDASFRNACIWT